MGTHSAVRCVAAAWLPILVACQTPLGLSSALAQTERPFRLTLPCLIMIRNPLANCPGKSADYPFHGWLFIVASGWYTFQRS